MGLPEQQAEPELILRGQLQELDLGTLLSALQLGRQYLTLDLFDAGGEHHGSLSVKSGRVVSASVGDKTGADAVRQLLYSTEASEFHVRLQPPGVEAELEPVGTIAALSHATEAEPEPDCTRVVQGVLSESLSLDDLLRVVAFTRQHVIVELSDDAGTLLGQVRAKSGKILSAQAGELVALAAVQELLRAPVGTTFVLYTDPQSVEQLHPLGTFADVLARAAERPSVPSNGFRKTLPPPLPRSRRNSETAPQARILEGSLDEFELSHVLRVLSTSRQHFELHVRDDAAKSVGVIDVKSGFIVGASTEKLKGLAAARELLGARNGRFVAIRRAEPTSDRPALASVNELLQPEAASKVADDTQPLSQTVDSGKGVPVLDGKLGDLDVASLLRVAAASRQYTGVHIFDKARRPIGSIYVKGGHIVRAKAQEATGVAAVRRLLHSPRDFIFLVQRYPSAPQVTTAIGSIASVLERAGAATTQPAFTAPPPEAAATEPHSRPNGSSSLMGAAALGAGLVLLGGIATALVMNVTAPPPATVTTLSPITTTPPQPPQTLAPPVPPEPPENEAKAEPAATADAANSGKNDPASALSKATIASLQAGLHQLGYETGPIDGKVGPRTTAAIKAFQYAEHLQADGTLSPPTRAVLQRRIGEP